MTEKNNTQMGNEKLAVAYMRTSTDRQKTSPWVQRSADALCVTRPILESPKYHVGATVKLSLETAS